MPTTTEVIDVGVARGNGLYRILKRLIDLVVSIILLGGLAPLYLLIAAVIKLDSHGPVLYVTKAIGLRQQQFVLLKFRSMHTSPDDSIEIEDVQKNVNSGSPTLFKDGAPIYKTALTNEKRITRAGRVLRKCSLDELPQLWNVFRGDMSLVGPRPSLPREASLYQEWQKQRFLIKPGLTGLYQVTARNRVPVDEMIRIDLTYIRSQSLWGDLHIILRTPLAMFRGL